MLLYHAFCIYSVSTDIWIPVAVLKHLTLDLLNTWSMFTATFLDSYDPVLVQMIHKFKSFQIEGIKD